MNSTSINEKEKPVQALNKASTGQKNI